MSNINLNRHAWDVGAKYFIRSTLLCTRHAPHQDTNSVLRLRYDMSRELKQSERQLSWTKKWVPSALLIAGSRVVPIALETAAGSPSGRLPAAVLSFLYARACTVASFRKCVLLLLYCVLFIVLPVFVASVCHAWSAALTTVFRAVDAFTPLCNRWLIFPAFRTGFSQSVVMHSFAYIRRLALRFRGGSLHSFPQ